MSEDESQREVVDGGGALRNTSYRRLTRSRRRMGPMRRERSMPRGVQGVAGAMERVLHETYHRARAALLENSL